MLAHSPQGLNFEASKAFDSFMKLILFVIIATLSAPLLSENMISLQNLFVLLLLLLLFSTLRGFECNKVSKHGLMP